MVEIRIILDDTGRITITGPIKNKVLTLGIIESAKYAVLSQPNEPTIHVPDYPP